MSESFVLPELPRGTLLPEAARLERLATALPLIEAVVAGEADEISVEATLACLLWRTFVQANWCGFYRVVAERELAVGPYQGGLGCLRIDFARGVCGACARERRTQLVGDVHAFAGHIACDAATASELVVPVSVGGVLVAVLDLDSTHPNGYSTGEARLLEGLLERAFAGVRIGRPAALTVQPFASG